MGAKYALGLGGATAAYVLLDEGAGWVRERVTNVPVDKGKGKARDVGIVDGVETVERRIVGGRKGWRSGPVHWEDGAVAGMLMGAGVGLIYTLPRPLFIRALIMGTLLGGATSALQTAQDYVGRLRAAQDAEPRLPTALPPPNQTAAGTKMPLVREGAVVDRKLAPGEAIGGVPVDETRAEGGDTGGGEGSWWSWIPGLGK